MAFDFLKSFVILMKTNGCFCLTSYGSVIIYRVGVGGRLREFGEVPVVLSRSNEGKVCVTR